MAETASILNPHKKILLPVKEAGCPMAVRYPRDSGLGVKLDNELQEIPIGKGEILRSGDDVAIVAIGATVTPALEAAAALAAKGIEATVVNARFAKPLDTELILELARRIKCMVTVEENALSGGFGSSIVKLLQEADICNLPVKNLGIPDEFVEHGTQPVLRAKYSLDADGIVHQVLTLLPEHVPASSPKIKKKVGAT